MTLPVFFLPPISPHASQSSHALQRTNGGGLWPIDGPRFSSGVSHQVIPPNKTTDQWVPVRDPWPVLRLSPILPDSGIEKEVVYTVSDTHLMSHDFYNKGRIPLFRSDPTKHLTEFLKRLNRKQAKRNEKEHTTLVLAGDFMDLLNCWYTPPTPQHPNKAEVEKRVTEVMRQIMKDNPSVFKQLRKFLSHSNTRLVYTVGNHDHPLLGFENAQRMFKEMLLGPQRLAAHPDKIQFTQEVQFPHMKLCILHGNQADRVHHTRDTQDFPLADYLAIEVMNPIMTKVAERMMRYGYSQEARDLMLESVENLEAVRPLPLIPKWFANVMKTLKDHPENKDKPESMDQILKNVSLEVLLKPEANMFVTAMIQALRGKNMTAYKQQRRRLPMMPGWIYQPLVGQLVKNMESPGPLFRWIVSKLAKHHSNKRQQQLAIEVAKRTGCDIVVMGHTHLCGHEYLKDGVFWFNTGTWRNFVQPATDPFGTTRVVKANEIHSASQGAYLKIVRDIKREKPKVEARLRNFITGGS